MSYVPSEYWVRVKVTGDESGANTYHSALDLARKLARQNPGLYFQVAEDKVWSGTVFAPGGNNGQEELP
jgi:hypothetical protein